MVLDGKRAYHASDPSGGLLDLGKRDIQRCQLGFGGSLCVSDSRFSNH